MILAHYCDVHCTIRFPRFYLSSIGLYRIVHIADLNANKIHSADITGTGCAELDLLIKWPGLTRGHLLATMNKPPTRILGKGIL